MTERTLIRAESSGDLADGEVRAITAGGRRLVAIRVGDERIACANQCLHLGVRLSDGHLDGSIIECRWHHWRFDLVSGAVDAEESPYSSFETYRVLVDGDDLLIDPSPRTRQHLQDQVAQGDTYERGTVRG